MSRSQDAKLSFQPPRLEHLIRKEGIAKRVNKNAVLYGTAILESFIRMVLQQGSDVLVEQGNSILAPSHIKRGIENHPQLRAFLGKKNFFLSRDKKGKGKGKKKAMPPVAVPQTQ